MAHDCFSLTCNMEGIVRVLQAARHLSHAHLAPGEHFGLLVSPAHTDDAASSGVMSGARVSAGEAADGCRQVQRDDVRLGPAASEPPLRDPAEEERGRRRAAGLHKLLPSRCCRMFGGDCVTRLCGAAVAEFRAEDGSVGLPEALPTCGQREAQHGGAVLQHEERDRGEPRDGRQDAAEDDRVSGLG